MDILTTLAFSVLGKQLIVHFGIFGAPLSTLNSFLRIIDLDISSNSSHWCSSGVKVISVISPFMGKTPSSEPEINWCIMIIRL